MTVSVTSDRRTFSCDGSTTVFTCNFRILESTEMVVYLVTIATGAAALLSNGVDYTVSGVGGASSIITTVSTYSSAYQLKAYRSTQRLQPTDYRDNDPLPAETLERALDRGIHIAQEQDSSIARAYLVPEPEVGGTLAAASSRASKLFGFDSDGNATVVAPSSGSAADLALQLISTDDATEAAGQVGFSYALAYPNDTVGAQVGHYINAAVYGALADGSTNNTTAVQAALDALGSSGGTVEVKRGTKFNLQSLTFPIRSNLDFWMDDDLSRPNPSTTLGTNEKVRFRANANGSGVVNEDRFTAAFHPSLNVDVRRDVPGHDAHLGASQERVPDASTPARASFNIFDQQVDTFRTVYEIYGGAFSKFSGVTMHGWRRVVVLTGVGTGTGGWTTTPSVGTEITGGTSGAKGWFLSATSTTTTVLWLSGKFAAGDTLTDDDETTSNTLSSAAFSLTPMQPLGQGLMRGNWSVGLPVGDGEEVLNVGGRVAILPSRDFSQYNYKSITHPGLVLSDLVSDVPTNAHILHLDLTAAAAERRPTWRKMLSGTESTQDVAHAAAVRAYVQFTDSAIVSDSAFNVSSITRTGTGVYEVNIPSGVLITVDPCVTFGTESPLTYPVCDWASSTATKLVIKTYTTGTSTAADIIGRLSVTVVGGDI